MLHHDIRPIHQYSFPRKHDWALGILAKEPLPGQVKTRLSPPFSPEAAARIYRCSLAETVANMATGPFDCILFFSGSEGYFQQNFPNLPCTPQTSGALGVRIDHALTTLLAAGYQAAALIGSDSPDLPQCLVGEAFTALSTTSAVIIPAGDGGYVLIGERQHCPSLFQNIPWSGAGVMAATRRQAVEAGIMLSEVGTWEDVDDLAGLKRLIARSPQSSTSRLILADYAHHLGRGATDSHPATAVAAKGRPAD